MEIETATTVRTVTVSNPATGEVLCQLDCAGTAEVNAAVRRGRAALPAWQATPIRHRLSIVERFQGLVADQKCAIANTVTSAIAGSSNFSRFTADKAMVAYDQSLVIADMLIQRGTVDWNALFRALSDSSRTEYTFDNFGLRYSDLESELGAPIDARAASLSR